MPSIGLGRIILVAAFVVVAVGTAAFLPRLFDGGGPQSEATGLPSTPGAGSPSEAVEPSPTEAVEITPAPLGSEAPLANEATAAVVSFLEEFDAAYRAADSAFLIDHLDPAVIAAFSSAACRDSIELFATEDFATVVRSVSGPTAWTYAAPNGHSTIISAAYLITGERTRAGKTTDLSMHLSFKDGRFYWFSTC
jgi:hypothetical protein